MESSGLLKILGEMSLERLLVVHLIVFKIFVYDKRILANKAVLQCAAFFACAYLS